MLKSDANWTDLDGKTSAEDTHALFAPGEGIGEGEGTDVHLTDEEVESEDDNQVADEDEGGTDEDDKGMSNFLDKAQSFAETLGKLRGDKD